MDSNALPNSPENPHQKACCYICVHICLVSAMISQSSSSLLPPVMMVLVPYYLGVVFFHQCRIYCLVQLLGGLPYYLGVVLFSSMPCLLFSSAFGRILVGMLANYPYENKYDSVQYIAHICAVIVFG